MTLAPAGAPAPARRTAEADRRDHIMKAAARAFVRFGFHATTMHHVAEEAGMSAGNLYRYFPSKEAIVEGLCLMDQAERAEVFSLFSRGGDIAHTMVETLREHLLATPVEKARMIVEIWAEAGRNPRVAAIGASVDAEVLAGIEKVLEAAKAIGQTRADLDSRFVARVMFTLVAGLFKRHALEPDFNTRAEADMAVGVFEALLAGAIAPAKEN